MRAPPVNIEIQEAVGFTITENVSVSNAVRVDYDRALALIEQGRSDQGIMLLESVVESAPERGTTFRIMLPLAEDLVSG